jgi:hypothetical protein
LVVMAISLANDLEQFRNQADSAGESQVYELLQSRLAQQFAELCLSYAEFSNRHSLFDVHAFRDAYISSPAQAVLTAAQSMRTAALGYKEAHAQQKQLRLNANTT